MIGKEKLPGGEHASSSSLLSGGKAGRVEIESRLGWSRLLAEEEIEDETDVGMNDEAICLAHEKSIEACMALCRGT